MSILIFFFPLTPLVTIFRLLHCHHSITSSVARELVERIGVTLNGVWLPASESDTQGQVVVITGGGTMSVVALLDALKLKIKAAAGLILLGEDVVKVNDYSQNASDLFF